MTNDNLNPMHVEWSRQHFACIRNGGTWAVPRSGLIFIKRNKELHLVARMPYDSAMPISAAELHEQQESDFQETKAHFGAAGIKVVDKSEKEGRP